LSFSALSAWEKWPPEGTMKFFLNALITKFPPGNRRFEGEKRCIMKMSGVNTGKFGQKDEVRTVGMATAPNSKDVRARYL
jgi:hypothetical protein